MFSKIFLVTLSTQQTFLVDLREGHRGRHEISEPVHENGATPADEDDAAEQSTAPVPNTSRKRYVFG